MTEDDQFRAELEEAGEEEVRKRYACGRIYGARRRPLVQDWLAQKDRERYDKALERQELRADKALATAKEANEYAAKANEHAAKANEHADKANCIAWFAFAAAAIATLIATASLIAPVVGWLK